MAGRLSRREIEALQATVGRGNLTAAAAELQEKLESLENTPLDIAITGESGAGKSSLVNAILGLHDDDEGAAKTGVTQTTMEPMAYPHPRLPNVKLWDLPGIGTKNFQADKYLNQVNFKKYDFFIIVSATRFTSHHITLAREIHKLGKRFYYVRSKVDIDLNAEKRKKNFNEARTLQEIREDCLKNLREAGEASPRVFLLSSWELANYDFQLLQETLENELDAQKRHVFILALSNISAKILEKKKAELQEHIWAVARLSCAIGAVPVPGLSLTCDVAILVGHMKRYCEAFGLDDESLSRLAQQVDKPVAELKSVIKKSPLASEITEEFVLTVLSRSGCGALMVLELVLNFVPALGSLAGGVISFVTTYYLLQSFLDDTAEDAQNILTKAFEPKAKKSI
ncbi:interferon-inducible GTPase 5-like [Malaclemys terrapin pileata]|uniref:interferon-inducible GTPase 5-like n=1 Tax=Malaclemys terrapin pileata TaxID=2991368 RepID=UPI0023A7D0DB|nr:interferon-inducible GTPase 5-like [Malaclemys terrapin pileata]